mgnify:CR=1 FL=1
MRKFIFFILASFLLFSCSNEKTKTFETGNFWKITSNSGVESYIFGTIHLYPKDELELSQNIISKLEHSEILALERNITDLGEQEQFMTSHQTQFIIKMYNALASAYGNKLISMEGELIDVALKNHIAISGLETTDEILENFEKTNLFDSLMLDMKPEQIIEDYTLTLNMYKSEQILQIKDSLSSILPKEMEELIVNERNRNWIDDIIQLIEKKQTFIAVGQAHLGGKDGLIQLLNDKGYKIERVY